MRQITKTKAVSFASLGEIRRALRDEVERLADMERMKGGKRKAEPTYLMNWLACYYLTRTARERTQIARSGKEILDIHMRSDVEICFGIKVDEAGELAPEGARAAGLGGQQTSLEGSEQLRGEPDSSNPAVGTNRRRPRRIK